MNTVGLQILVQLARPFWPSRAGTRLYKPFTFPQCPQRVIWLSWSALQEKNPFFPVKFMGLKAVARMPRESRDELGKEKHEHE